MITDETAPVMRRPPRPPDAPEAQPPLLRVAVVGSRAGIPAWQTAWAVERLVREAHAAGIVAGRLLIVSGAAGRAAAGGPSTRYPESVDRVGVDRARALGCQTLEVPASWRVRDPQTGQVSVDRGAGMARNGQVIAGADLVLALDAGTPGTADALARARAACIPTVAARPLPRVYSLRDGPLPDHAVYVGRGRGGAPGLYGNPYPLRDERERPAVLAAHAAHALERLVREPEWLFGLAGRSLAGFCHGPGAAAGCHADTLARLANPARAGEFPPLAPLRGALEHARAVPALARALAPYLAEPAPLLDGALLA